MNRTTSSSSRLSSAKANNLAMFKLFSELPNFNFHFPNANKGLTFPKRVYDMWHLKTIF